MKNKKANMMILTLAIVGLGAGLLFLSTNWVMADVQERLESTEDIVAMKEEATEEAEVSEMEAKRDALKDALTLRQEQYEGLKSLATAEFVYYGQAVYVKDDMVEKEAAIENGRKIMDFVFDYVDRTILTPYNIDKTAYTYSIQRQNEGNSVRYGVFFLKGDRIECHIGVCLDNGVELDAFARDGLIDLYGAEENPIPKEYLTENWCDNRQKKEDIYDAYYESSKEVIENVLGLAPIDDSFRDVSKESCFTAGDHWSIVTFGYHLEDGTQIKVFYNRVNQMWDGFYIP